MDICKPEDIVKILNTDYAMVIVLSKGDMIFLGGYAKDKGN